MTIKSIYMEIHFTAADDYLRKFQQFVLYRRLRLKRHAAVVAAYSLVNAKNLYIEAFDHGLIEYSELETFHLLDIYPIRAKIARSDQILATAGNLD